MPVGNIKQLTQPGDATTIIDRRSTTGNWDHAVLGVMSSLVCMGILFGTKRTLNTALALECVAFAKELYARCQQSS